MWRTLLLATSERWKPVVGYEGLYEVSDQGRVKSFYKSATGKIRQPVDDTHGYWDLMLSKNGTSKHHKVHWLVLEAFVGPRPQGYYGCHKNDVRKDNRLENLYWGTPKENSRDTLQNGGHLSTKQTHCVNGHEYTSSNTQINSRGARECRVCIRARHVRWYESKGRYTHARWYQRNKDQISKRRSRGTNSGY